MELSLSPPPSNLKSNDSFSTSVPSSPSISSSFPTYGLIKISNTDDTSSMESFPLATSINNLYVSSSHHPHHHHHHHHNSKSGTGLPDSRSPNPFRDPLSPGASIMTSTVYSKTMENTTLPVLLGRHHNNSQAAGAGDDPAAAVEDSELANIQAIPKFGITRSKFFFDKIIEAYHSSASRGGVFLTENVFLNNKIFKSSETIQNGSVKINIVQEINELLKRFLASDVALQPTQATIESILPYYSKLMDAFDVLKNEQLDTALEIDSMPSDDGSSFNYSPQKSLGDSCSVHSGSRQKAPSSQGSGSNASGFSTTNTTNNTISGSTNPSGKESFSQGLQSAHVPQPSSGKYGHQSSHAVNPKRHSGGSTTNLDAQQTLKQHKRSDSFLLGKFKSKKQKNSSLISLTGKPGPQATSPPQTSTSNRNSRNLSQLSRSLTPSPKVLPDYKRSSVQSNSTMNSTTIQTSTGTYQFRHSQHSQHSHTRSGSLSTVATQFSSSRSAKDQASIGEYLSSLEFLQITLGEIYDEYIASEDKEVCHKLNLVVDFLNEYILRFVLKDILNLILKHMRKSVHEFL